MRLMVFCFKTFKSGPTLPGHRGTEEASTPLCSEGHTEYRLCFPGRIATGTEEPKGGLDETFGKVLIAWNSTVLHDHPGAAGVSANSVHNRATTGATAAQPPQGQWCRKRCSNWCYDGWQCSQGCGGWSWAFPPRGEKDQPSPVTLRSLLKNTLR